MVTGTVVQALFAFVLEELRSLRYGGAGDAHLYVDVRLEPTP